MGNAYRTDVNNYTCISRVLSQMESNCQRTPVPVLSISSNSLDLTPVDIDRHGKYKIRFKIAVAKPEVVASRVLEQLESKF